MRGRPTPPDGRYHTSEFALNPQRCDRTIGCHKGHLWIVDGKEQHHKPDRATIDPAKGNTLNRIAWQNIAITSLPPSNEDWY